MRIRIHALATLVVVALPAVALAQRSEQTSESKWSDQLDAGHWTRISNLNGSVTVGQSTSNRVEVVATKHWRRGNPDDVKIVTKKDGDDVVICALYGRQEECNDPSNNGRRRGWNDWNSSDDDNNDVWVDFAVLIPKGTKLRTGTVTGSQTITGATADVDASTVNGSLRVESGAGPVRATAVNGRIYGRITSGSASEPMDFTTVNGSVTVELPESLGADVTMSTTNGHLDSDFPLVVRGRIDPRHLSMHVGNGSGGPQISLTTVNGDVELRKR
jgi:hypothetical protein